MKRILIFTFIATNLFGVGNQGNIIWQQIILQALVNSQTPEKLNDKIAALRLSNKASRSIIDQNAWEIISVFFQNKFPGEFSSSDFFAEALNKGPLYYQYLEPFIFITKNLKLNALNKLLINSGVDTNLDINGLYQDYNIVRLISDIGDSSDEDIKNGLEKRLKFLLKIGFANFKDRNRDTALIAASIYGLKNITELLIQSNANVNAKGDGGNTALIWAAHQASNDIAELLINAGANVNDKDAIEGYAALIWASIQGNKDLVELLIKAGANVDEKDNYGETALIWAAKNNRKNIVDILINAGANVNEKDNEGKTVLMYAAMDADEDMVSQLIAAGANVNDRNKMGWSALDLACGSGGIMTAILKHQIGTE